MAKSEINFNFLLSKFQICLNHFPLSQFHLLPLEIFYFSFQLSPL